MDRVKGLFGWGGAAAAPTTPTTTPAPTTPTTTTATSSSQRTTTGTITANDKATVTGEMPLEHIQRVVAATKQAYDACEAKRMTAVTNGKEAGDCEEQYLAFKRAFEAQISAEATIYNNKR